MQGITVTECVAMATRPTLNQVLKMPQQCRTGEGANKVFPVATNEGAGASLSTAEG